MECTRGGKQILTMENGRSLKNNQGKNRNHILLLKMLCQLCTFCFALNFKMLWRRFRNSFAVLASTTCAGSLLYMGTKPKIDLRILTELFGPIHDWICLSCDGLHDGMEKLYKVLLDLGNNLLK